MLKKFLFYFAIFLCSGGLLCRCTKKISSDLETRSLSDVRWLPTQSFHHPFYETSQQTLFQEGLFRLSAGGSNAQPMPQLVQDVTWRSKKQVEITVVDGPRPFSPAEIVDGIRLGFHSSDTLLVDSLAELFQNGREYTQGRIPFSSVGVRQLGTKKVQLTLRRHAPHLLRMVLSHPGTWPRAKTSLGPLQTATHERSDERIFSRNPYYQGPPVRVTNLHARQISDSFTRTYLVLNGEADFTGDIDPALLSVAKKTIQYQERFSAWRLILILNPARASLRDPALRKELAHSIDPRDLSRFVPSLIPINRLLERSPTPEKAGWFASLEPRAGRRPLTSVVGPLRLKPVLPYPQPEGLTVLQEAASNLTAQLGKVGVSMETLVPSFQPPTVESLSEPELTLMLVPALPLAATSWSEVFSFLNRRLNDDEFENLFAEWDLTRDEERREVAIESYLSEREAVLVPLGALRRAFLSSPRLHAIQLSPFGYWDWTSVALAGR